VVVEKNLRETERFFDNRYNNKILNTEDGICSE